MDFFLPQVTSNDLQGHKITLKSKFIYSILFHVARGVNVPKKSFVGAFVN